MNAEKQLRLVRDRMDKAREELRIIEEQLLYQMDVVADAKTRALVSETPLADEEFRIARTDHARMTKERERILASMKELEAEQDRLLDQMLDARTR